MKAGTYTLHYQVAAGLDGNAKAVTDDGEPGRGRVRCHDHRQARAGHGRRRGERRIEPSGEASRGAGIATVPAGAGAADHSLADDTLAGGRIARLRRRRRRRDHDRQRPTAGRRRRPRSATGGAGQVGDGDGGVRLSEIGSFEQPVYVTQPPGDGEDLYVVEQGGRIQRLSPRRRRARLFLDIGDAVTCGGEQGLLSVAFAPDYEQSGLLYVDYTDTAGDDADRRVPALGRRPGGRRPGQRPRAARRSTTSPRTTTAACCCSAPTAALHRHRRRRRRRRPGAHRPESATARSASSCGSTRPEPDGPGEPYAGALATTSAFATHGGSRSTARTATWDRRRRPGRARGDRRRDREAAAPARDLNFGWSAFEGTRALQRRPEGPRRDRRPSTSTAATAATARSPAATWSATPSSPRSTAATSTATSAPATCTASPPSRARPARDDRPLGLEVDQLSSFGEDSAGHLYAVSLAGPVYRLVADELNAGTRDGGQLWRGGAFDRRAGPRRC